MTSASPPVASPLSGDLVDGVAGVLRERIGFDVGSIGREALGSAVARRLAATGVADLGRYVDRLRTVPRELDLLVEETSISETWFLRDPASFAWLRGWLVRSWMPAHPLRHLKVLSAPCSSGEEVWSLAVTLRESGLPAARYSIDGVDLRPGAVESARRGVYGERAFRSADADAMRDLYFTKEPGGWRVVDGLRASTRFWPGNILEGLPGTGPEPWDVVFCRNLLIYLDDAARERLVVALDRLLCADGLLVVGSAEALWMARTGVFEMVPAPGAFVLRRAPASKRRRRRTTRVALRSRPSRSLPVPPPREASPVAPPPAAAVKEPAATLASIDAARTLADRGEIDEATSMLRSLLSSAGPSADLFLLLAVCSAARGEVRASEELVDKALYLDPGDAEALELLVALREARGDRTGAAVVRERLARAREEGR